MKKFINLHACILIIFVLFCSPRFVQAAPSFAGEANIYFAAEFFEWKEFGDNNSRFLKESGPRYGIGGTYNFEFFNHHLILKPRLEIIGGEVNYNGQACDINTNICEPFKTDTNYFGGKVELDLGWRFGSLQRASIEPYAGIGFRGWLRDLQSGTANDGSRVAGYTEEWLTSYGRAGLRGSVALGEKTYVFAEVGGKFPFYTENTAYLSDAGLGPDVTLKPGNRPSLIAEAGVKVRLFKVSFYYDSMRFSQSDVLSNGYYQPKSNADMYGVHVGVAF